MKKYNARAIIDFTQTPPFIWHSLQSELRLAVGDYIFRNGYNQNTLNFLIALREKELARRKKEKYRKISKKKTGMKYKTKKNPNGKA